MNLKEFSIYVYDCYDGKIDRDSFVDVVKTHYKHWHDDEVTREQIIKAVEDTPQYKGMKVVKK